MGMQPAAAEAGRCRSAMFTLLAHASGSCQTDIRIDARHLSTFHIRGGHQLVSTYAVQATVSWINCQHHSHFPPERIPRMLPASDHSNRQPRPILSARPAACNVANNTAISAPLAQAAHWVRLVAAVSRGQIAHVVDRDDGNNRSAAASAEA